MAQEKHGWDDQDERDRNLNENRNNDGNEGQNALRNSSNETPDEYSIDDIADDDRDTTEDLNLREDETEPFNEDDDEDKQGSTTGGPRGNSDLRDFEKNREDLGDRGEDENV